MDINKLLEFVADKAGCTVDNVSWWSWPQVFGDSSGPHNRPAAQIITTFQVFGFNAHGTKDTVRIKYCAGVWRDWNGEPMGRW